MIEPHPAEASSIEARLDRPLIGIPVRENGETRVRYFVDDDAADSGTPGDVVERALAAIGSWSDLDWDEMEAALDRIRHESTPTPPIGLDL